MSKRKESIPVIKRQRFKNIMDGNRKKTRKKKGVITKHKEIDQAKVVSVLTKENIPTMKNSGYVF
jgi:Na+/H+-translocating membrane pyrophosphatase